MLLSPTLLGFLLAGQLTPGQTAQLELRQHARHYIVNRWVRIQYPFVIIKYGGRHRQPLYLYKLPEILDQFDVSPEQLYDRPIRAQILVEAIRLSRTVPHQQRFWKPHIEQIERFIAADMGEIVTPDSPYEPLSNGRWSPEAIIRAAFESDANSKGMVPINFASGFSADELDRCDYDQALQLSKKPPFTRANYTRVITASDVLWVEIIPLTSYDLAIYMGRPPNFQVLRELASLHGYYRYRLHRRDGTVSELKTKKVEVGGPVRLP